MLFLFTEVGERDAPTRVRVGSHRDVPAVLRPYGDGGAPTMTLGPQVAAASAHPPVALATGGPGDVYLCHPFLVHAAQPHHGTNPRFMAQPPLYPPLAFMPQPFGLAVTDDEPSPAARVIREALRR